MSAIEKYRKQVALQYEANRWAQMLGKKYAGGGGGTGALRSFDSSVATIYYQESDGSKNYHDSPEGLLIAIDAEIKKDFAAILSRAMDSIEQKRIEFAREAANEHAELMREAGMTP